MNPSFRFSRVGGVDGLDLLVCVPFAERGVAHGFSLRWRRLSGEQAREPFGLPGRGLSEREELVHRLGLRSVVPMLQVHGDQVKVIDGPQSPPQVCDGLATRRRGVALVVQTADCVPILMWDSNKGAVAAVHGGWRGTLGEIARKTVHRLVECFGTEPPFLYAALGPSIGACCYEVGRDVVDAFTARFSHSEDLFSGSSCGGTHLDLIEANRRQLIEAGVPANQIHVAGLCTSCESGLVYSYRKEGKGVGRLMGVIGISPYPPASLSSGCGSVSPGGGPA